MSISYEEALATLQSMFGPPWTRETLDFILRDQQGHMENTVDLLLRHGEKDPMILVQQLQRDDTPGAAAESSSNATPTQPTGNQSRGTPTKLPDDFLRVPGFDYSSMTTTTTSTSTSTSASTMEEDEALARMLQDELFSQELARTPEFAHLARHNRAQTTATTVPRSSTMTHATSNTNTDTNNTSVLEAMSQFGDATKRRLLLLAAQFKNKKEVNNRNAAEQRGLLSDDTEDMELAARRDL
jgi:hypothetical protein